MLFWSFFHIPASKIFFLSFFQVDFFVLCFANSFLSVSCFFFFVLTSRAIEQRCEQLFRGRSFWVSIDAYTEVQVCTLTNPF
ncbi:Uncharacterized protein TCM_035145 [Theobroma cacao]|uniref:Uncharacterized protein n=1 Tax=Theobroma cacao TaxID=3641 RepID=A0A061FI08_THECC|nr:Uncharacterized protein TCM_035145 [Theobroma cacao]